MVTIFLVFLGWGLLVLGVLGIVLELMGLIQNNSYVRLFTRIFLIISLVILNSIYKFTLFSTLVIVIIALIFNSILFAIFINAKYAQNPHTTSIAVVLIVFTIGDAVLLFNAISSILTKYIA